MPSPLAHIAVGTLLGQSCGGASRLRQSPVLGRWGQGPTLVAIALSVLPDLDSIPGFLVGDIGRFHNQATNSLLAALMVALLVAGILWWRRRAPFVPWFAFSLTAYGLHILMDVLTVGRGVMLLWPFSMARIQSPLKVFYGLHYSEGWLSVSHVWTLLTELLFVAVLLLGRQIVRRIRGRRSAVH